METKNLTEDLMEDFIEKFHKKEFEEYKHKLEITECAENFEFFNHFFKPGEIKTVIESVSSHEGMYRDANSSSYLSHGLLIYAPYYRGNRDTNTICNRNTYLSLYMYIIAIHENLDFYMRENCEGNMEPESVRFDPYLYDEIKNCYSLDDKGIHIDMKKI